MTPAHAAPCSVELRSKGADSAWEIEVVRARRALSEATDADSDCRSVLVEVDDEGVRVVLTTRDGRRAVRPLARASELLPTVNALMVTVQAEAEAKPADERPRRPDSEPKERTITQRSESHLLLAALGGARLGLPGGWVSPTMTAAVGFTRNGWEAGVTGSWLPVTLPLTQTPPAGFRASAWSVALSGGLRAGSGSVVWLAGADLGVAFVHEQVSNDDDVMMQGDVEANNDVDEKLEGSNWVINPIEMRLGVHAGFAFPRRARLRLRPQLSLSGAPLRFRDSRASDTLLPQLPSLSAELALGVEGDLL